MMIAFHQLNSIRKSQLSSEIRSCWWLKDSGSLVQSGLLIRLNIQCYAVVHALSTTI